MAGRAPIALLAMGLLLAACVNTAAGSAQQTVAFIPEYAGGPSPSLPATMPIGAPSDAIGVSLGETDPEHMYIDLSSDVVAAGKVSFVVTNEGTKTHEFVVLATKTPAADFPIVSFEGEANRIDEDAKGVTNVGETGDMQPGTTEVLSIDLPQGHYAVVCNLPGHYAAGMHQDLYAIG
jgi:uncharacterized cupredoxin-like copper-binding protein